MSTNTTIGYTPLDLIGRSLERHDGFYMGTITGFREITGHFELDNSLLLLHSRSVGDYRVVDARSDG